MEVTSEEGQKGNSSSSQHTVKNRSFQNNFKLTVVKQAEHIGNNAAARKYNVDERQVRLWRKQKGELGKCLGMKRIRFECAAKHPELESMLVAWFLKQQEDGRAVRINDILTEAKHIAKLLNIQNFEGSPTWVKRFMIRSCNRCESSLHLTKRPHFDEHFKLSVVECAEQFGRRAASNKYGITEKLLGEWCRNKAQIRRKLQRKKPENNCV